MRFPGEKIVIVELAQKQTDLGGEKTTDSQGNSSVSNLKLWFKFFSGKLKRV
jgi:hypothetical protein